MSIDFTASPYSGPLHPGSLDVEDRTSRLGCESGAELTDVTQVWLTVGVRDEPDVDVPAPVLVPVVDPPVHAVGVPLGMGVPGSRVVPERQLPHAWMAHEVDRRAVESSDVERVADDGDVEVGPDHQPERGAADEMRLTEHSKHVIEREIRSHRLGRRPELFWVRHHQQCRG